MIFVSLTREGEENLEGSQGSVLVCRDAKVGWHLGLILAPSESGTGLSPVLFPKRKILDTETSSSSLLIEEGEENLEEEEISVGDGMLMKEGTLSLF